MPELHTLWHEEMGLTTLEYALLLAFLVAAGVAMWNNFAVQTAASAGSSSDAVADSMR